MGFVKRLAGDLLTLEINTIVKEDMSAAKLPSSRRVAFLQLANEYRGKLDELGICALKVPEGVTPDNIPEGYFRWRFGGEFSFHEIYQMAKKGEKMYEEKIAKTPEEKRTAVKEEAKIVSRIKEQCSLVIGMFKNRRKDYQNKIKDGVKGFEEACNMQLVEAESGLFMSQLGSTGWNNDISLGECNNMDDMELNPDETALLRKATEIGTQPILMQTVIQIDGDVTTYMSTKFLRHDPQTRNMLLNLHNQSIGTATRFWGDLFKAIANIAGKAIHEIFGDRGSKPQLPEK
jgi:hypothetical protein